MGNDELRGHGDIEQWNGTDTVCKQIECPICCKWVDVEEIYYDKNRKKSICLKCRNSPV